MKSVSMNSYVEEDCATEAAGASNETGMRARTDAHFWVAPNLRDPHAGKLQRHGCLP